MHLLIMRVSVRQRNDAKKQTKMPGNARNKTFIFTGMWNDCNLHLLCYLCDASDLAFKGVNQNEEDLPDDKRSINYQVIIVLLI